MSRIADDGLTLWMWPWAMADLAQKWTATMWSSAEVIAVRLPIIADAWREPSDGNRRELSRMVTEKVEAITLSHRSLEPAHRAGAQAFTAWFRLVEGAMAGNFPGAGATARLAQANLALAAAWTSAPGAALAPIQRSAAKNARRLRNPR